MKLKKSFLVIVVCAVFLIGIVSYSNADPGDRLEVGDSPPLQAKFTDIKTGIKFNLILRVVEREGGAGGGVVSVFNYDFLSLCGVDNPVLTGPGVQPFPSIQCTWNDGLSVSIKNNSAKATYSVYVNSGYPFVPYIGSATMEIKFNSLWKNPRVEVQIHTPKEKIILSGKITGTISLEPQ
jgi:hypothetical protein